MLATRYIIALCPANKIYLASVDPVFREGMNLGQATVGVPALATQFNTFEAAMEVCNGITGWGGAQRVEQVAVEVPDTRQTLATEDDWHDVAAAASCAWDECSDCDSVTVRARHTEDYLRSIGLTVRVEVRAGASCSVTLYLADRLGNTLQLDFDPMVDGFDITEATCLAETEAQHEETATCDGFGSDDGEPCGEGFALCAACRKQDDPNPPAMTFDSAWLDGILGRDDLTFDQTPLTAEQAKHARLALASALRRLVLDNAPRLASSALTEARDNT